MAGPWRMAVKGWWLFGCFALVLLIGSSPIQAVTEHDVPLLAGVLLTPLEGGGLEACITLDSGEQFMEGFLEVAVKIDGLFVDGQAVWVSLRGLERVCLNLQTPPEAELEVHSAWTHMGRQYMLGEAHWPQRIRIGIMDTGFRRLYHQRVQFDAAVALVLEGMEGTSHHRVRGPIVLEQDGHRVVVSLADGTQLVFPEGLTLFTVDESLVRLPSIERGAWRPFVPAYRGFFEVTSHADGLLIVNEVALEEYLYQVLPSEMPVSWPLEALKAQAITARSFAVVSAQNSRYRSLGFHVDDSHSFQVYNNSPESARANQAIDATAGLILRSLHDGQPVQGFFYSTSPGATACASTVWGGRPTPYLRFRPLSDAVPEHGWQAENDVDAWLRDDAVPGFDERSPYFRWRVSLTQDQLRSNLRRALGRDPGRILDIKVLERGPSGNVMLLEVAGQQQVFLLEGDYPIRQAFSPRGASLTLNDGQVETGLSVLPSSFFTVADDRSQNELRGVTLYGGGSGHGVGMSQWAALGMAQAGLSAQEILLRFFSDIELAPVTGIYRSLENLY